MNFLDGWRGLAILTVLAGHFVAGMPGRLAGTGVELFFVLSGRLMAEMLIVRRQPLPLFFFRRASRLLPALAFYAAAMLILAAANPAYGELRDALTGAIAALLFFHNYLAPEHVSPLFEHCWSLAVEEHSYLLLAAVAAVAVRDRRTAMAIAAVLAAAAMLNGWRLSGEEADAAQSVYRRTDVRAASILISFAIFLWLREHVRTARGGLWGAASPAGLAIGLALLVHPAVPDPLRFSLGTSLLALSVATIDRAPALFRRLFALKALTLLGLVSYSLYLWQQPFYQLAKENMPPAVALGLALAGGILSFRNVERPARRALNRWWDARRRGTETAEAPSAA